jgi:hypothetical protein
LKILVTKGIFNHDGKIVLNSMRTVHWRDLTDEKLPQLPAGTSIDLSISIEESIFLSGVNGIVWATYDSRQAEIIHNTLTAQQISSEIQRIEPVNRVIFLIKITNTKDLYDVMEFIWKSNGGLRLKPDWSYPEGEANKSFELWLNGQ